jgi:hypothetical protein
MSSPANPPSLDHLSTRPFSFYPAIIGIEHNEWLYRKATWSEILVVNCKTEQEWWISRRYIGEVSKVDDPVLIVGLNKELEYKGGTVWPHNRRVLQMPTAAPPAPEAVEGAEAGPEPPMSGVGSEPASDMRIVKLIGGVVAIAVLAYLGVLNYVRVGELRQRIKFTTKDQTYLELSARDDYFGVVQKLGTPSQDRWQSDTGAIQYQAMAYPERGYTIILMGGDRKSVLYIGTLDSNWVPVHSVQLRSGGTTFAMLRELKRF